MKPVQRVSSYYESYAWGNGYHTGATATIIPVGPNTSHCSTSMISAPAGTCTYDVPDCNVFTNGPNPNKGAGFANYQFNNNDETIPATGISASTQVLYCFNSAGYVIKDPVLTIEDDCKTLGWDKQWCNNAVDSDNNNISNSGS